MAVSLEGHKFVNFDSAKLGHPTHIVARQVDEHHMFGALFGVFAQLASQTPVVFVVATTLASASNWATDDAPVAHLYEWLG